MTDIWLIGTLSLTPINQSILFTVHVQQIQMQCKNLTFVHKGADQSAHTCRLISAYVIQFSERITSKLSSSKISII